MSLESSPHSTQQQRKMASFAKEDDGTGEAWTLSFVMLPPFVGRDCIGHDDAVNNGVLRADAHPTDNIDHHF